VVVKFVTIIVLVTTIEIDVTIPKVLALSNSPYNNDANYSLALISNS
jgi:hypothetical protein